MSEATHSVPATAAPNALVRSWRRTSAIDPRFVIGGFLAISSKYVLRYRGTHLWNPTNFAISALILAAPDRVSVLSHQFGNDFATNVVIWIFGLIIAARVGVLHITLAYVASFLALNGAR